MCVKRPESLVLNERMKLRSEKSKIWKMREIDFRLTLKEVVVTKKVWGLEGKILHHEIIKIYRLERKNCTKNDLSVPYIPLLQILFGTPCIHKRYRFFGVRRFHTIKVIKEGQWGGEDWGGGMIF